MLMKAILEGRARKLDGSHPEQAGGIWAQILKGKDELAGVEVNEWTVQNLSTVMICTRSIAEDVAKLPLHLFRRLATGGRDRATDDPAYEILLRNPNPEMTAFTFRETLQHHALLWGNGYAEIEFKKSGAPWRAWPLKPTRMRVRRPTPDRDLEYRYTREDGRVVVLPASSVFHVHGLGYDGLVGYSTVQCARLSMGSALAAERFAAGFWGNQAMPAAVLTHPAKLGPEAAKRMKDSWNATYKGAEKTGGVAVLEEGVQLKELQMPMKDAQFLESRQFSVPEICRWFRFPPHKAGDLSRATFSNIEHQSLEYVTDTLLSWLVRWEQEAARKLLPEARRTDLYFEHMLDAILRGDTKTRFENYKSGLLTGIFTPDEVREKENMNPHPNGAGSVIMVPVNMTTPEKLGETQAAPSKADPSLDPTKDDVQQMEAKAKTIAKSYRAVLETTLRPVLRVEVDKLRRSFRRNELPEFVRSFYREHTQHVRAAIAPSVIAANDTLALVGLRPLSVSDVAMRLATDLTGRSIAALEAKDVDVETLLSGWETDRAGVEADECVRSLTSLILEPLP